MQKSRRFLHKLYPIQQLLLELLQSLIQRLYEQNKPLIVVSMRSPYDLAYLPNVPVYMATYEASVPALQMAAKAIYGLVSVTGKLPVTLP
jgi:beta-N-acetylhexosaminidase